MSKRILIIGPAWIGDMIMAQVLFKLLKQLDADTTIDVVAPPWNFPLLERMAEVNQSLVLAAQHGEFAWLKRRKMGKRLRKADYQQAIVLPNSWKSALIPWFAQIPQRTGWLGEMRWGLLNDIRHLDKQNIPLMTERFAKLALAEPAVLPQKLAYPQLSIDEQQIASHLQKYQLSTQRPILALCPGAQYGPAKRWPCAHFAQTAQYFIGLGWQVWLFGSQQEIPLAEEIQQQLPDQVIDLVGKINLAEAIDLLSLANLVISNDSGLMHVACALKKPVVAIYGSTDPGFTPPLATDVKILQHQLSCSPCFQRECRYQHYRCLTEITPEQAIQAAEQLLAHATLQDTH